MRIIYALFTSIALMAGNPGCSVRESSNSDVTLVASVNVVKYIPQDEESRNDPSEIFQLEYTIDIINNGSDSVTLPTKGVDPLTYALEESILVKLEWDVPNDASSSAVNAEFGFVNIKKNEKVTINWKGLESQKARLGNIKIVYSVSDEFSKRYMCTKINISNSTSGSTR